MSSNCKHTEWILETIDHLRRRKARPDLERICHVVRRRHGLGAVETEAKIEKLVDSEIVIKVDYKGSTSYRNAAKWRKSMLGCAVLNSTTISTKILEAILEQSLTSCNEEKARETKDTDDDIQFNNEAERKDAAITYGTSIENINSWLQNKCEGFEDLKCPLIIALKREVDARRIKKLENGNYVITPEQAKEINDGIIQPLKVTKKVENSASSSSSSSKPGMPLPPVTTSVSAPGPCAVGGGPGHHAVVKQHLQGQAVPRQHLPPSHQGVVQPARRGRPPKHRPLVLAATPSAPSQPAATPPTTASSSKLKRILTTSPQGQSGDGPDKKAAKIGTPSSEPSCDFCHLSSQANPSGEAEMLLCCKDCVARAHPSCMKYSQVLASRAYKGPWQCMDCKTCCVCQDPGEPDQMLFCDGCDKGYHMNCHRPPIQKKPSGTWECSECKRMSLAIQRDQFTAQVGSKRNFSHDPAPLTPSESPVTTMNGDHQAITSSPKYSPNGMYPDASDWSVDDAVDYFSSAGFKEEAGIFREQEIDGVALLLLKRADVLKGLNIKLGPALKINRHIQGLQMAKQNLSS